MVGAFRVRKVVHPEGRVSHWIVTSQGEIHRVALEVLTGYSESSQQTYAYGLADHLNWLSVNDLTTGTVGIDDLRRYMNGLTGHGSGVFGLTWRERGPLGASAAANVASVVKAFYLRSPDTSPAVVDWFSQEASLRRRSGLIVTANPLAPRKGAGRPRYLPDEFVRALLEPGVLRSARDTMIVTWLADSGIRVGGLCGLRFSDLHLVREHPCAQRKDPHVHIVGRDDNPNRARAKAYRNAGITPDGHVIDGVIRAVSESMIVSLYAYLLDEYHAVQHLVDHDMVLVDVKGRAAGTALKTNGVRKMLRKACERAGLDSYITPHAFRHRAAANLYEASDFNPELVAQEFGWASADQVTQLYGRSANRTTMKFLQQAWESHSGAPASTSP